jgi:hypothetical protein
MLYGISVGDNSPIKPRNGKSNEFMLGYLGGHEIDLPRSIHLSEQYLGKLVTNR